MWQKSESSVKPLEYDSESSFVYVYLRRNISENVVVDEMSGEENIFYEYEERKILKSEYDSYLEREQLRADMTYMSMMIGVDL